MSEVCFWRETALAVCTSCGCSEGNVELNQTSIVPSRLSVLKSGKKQLVIPVIITLLDVERLRM